MRRSVIGFSALVLVTGAGVAPAAAGCTITGTPDGDTLTGTPGRDVICGLGGRDVIRGLQGDDLLLGGDGGDLLRGEDGADRTYGGAGADYFTATQGSTARVAGDGPDFFSGGPGPDTAEYHLRTTAVRVSLDGAADDGAHDRHLRQRGFRASCGPLALSSRSSCGWRPTVSSSPAEPPPGVGPGRSDRGRSYP